MLDRRRVTPLQPRHMAVSEAAATRAGIRAATPPTSNTTPRTSPTRDTHHPATRLSCPPRSTGSTRHNHEVCFGHRVLLWNSSSVILQYNKCHV
ncbi:unnamed protein product [Ixodes persulcatus]